MKEKDVHKYETTIFFRQKGLVVEIIKQTISFGISQVHLHGGK